MGDTADSGGRKKGEVTPGTFTSVTSPRRAAEVAAGEAGRTPGAFTSVTSPGRAAEVAERQAGQRQNR